MVSKSLIFLLCAVVVVLADDKKATYTNKYDNIDLDEILGNKKLLLSYFNCVMGKGKCTPDGKELKDNLQDAIETGCEKCTEPQSNGATKLIKHLIEHEFELWNELCAKFDPEGTFRKKYEDEARSRGIEIPQ